jgi:intracellular septation protein
MTDAATAKPEGNPLLKLAVDFGPLVVFFAVNALSGGLAITRVMTATAAFMVATAVAMIVSRWKLGHISPMLWMSGALVLVFGGLTLWFHDETFIKMKPTIVYAMFAAILGFGLATGRPLLRSLLESAYPGLTAEGWRKLTINWTIFFIGMAILNEIVWRSTSWDFWVGFKLWGAVPLTIVFAISNIPMLLKHGLNTDPKKTVAALPPEG